MKFFIPIFTVFFYIIYDYSGEITEWEADDFYDLKF
jgi:hypothetical protein